MADGIKFDLMDDLTNRVRFAGVKMRSVIAREMNKGILDGRRDIVEHLMTRTGLKRALFNDRISVTRASPSSLSVRLTPLFKKRIYMTTYPYQETQARGGLEVIRLTSYLYRKDMRTAFMSKDGSRMYLRLSDHEVRSVRGRSIPRLFETYQIKQKYEPQVAAGVLERIKAGVGPEVF
jgi:hypothetical protein